jgi:hypothetical protein
MVVYACNPRHLGGGDRKITGSRSPWAKLKRHYLKAKLKKWSGGMAQVIEYLLSKLRP